jgi:selenide,water dikinase
VCASAHAAGDPGAIAEAGAAVVDVDRERVVVACADFFAPVVDDPFDWGRIAAAYALSGVYAKGGAPVVALDVLLWPRDDLPAELADEVRRGSRSATEEAGCVLSGGQRVDGHAPRYGMAVTGTARPESLLRIGAARPGDPITVTKPLGTGVYSGFHHDTGEPIDEAVAVMSTLNREAAAAAVEGGIQAATDVSGLGLLGHLHAMATASGVTAVVDSLTVPFLEQARRLGERGHLRGEAQRNLAWVRPGLESDLDETELLLLCDAEASGGLLLAGEVPGAPVVGEFVEPKGPSLIVR